MELASIEAAVELETTDKMAKLGDDHEVRMVKRWRPPFIKPDIRTSSLLKPVEFSIELDEFIILNLRLFLLPYSV